MLLLRRTTRNCLPLGPSHARFVTTFPKPTPTYVRGWDPTQHSPQSTVLATPQDAPQRDVRRVEREQLRRSQGPEVFLTNRSRNNDGDGVTVLNKLLHMADTKANTPGVRLKLWQVYSQAKKRLSDLASQMPDKAWDILWKTQRGDLSPPTTRALRLEELDKDMLSVGDYETVGERVQYLKSLFLSGNQKQALKEWEEDHNGGNDLPRHDYKPEHLEIGARIHAGNGNPDRARQIMEELFELYPSWDPSIMKVVFRAHTESTSPQHHDFARGIYKKLKEKLDTDLTLEDYDVCFVGFLEARHFSYAKAVFRDMIKEGYLATSFSPKRVHEVLQRLHMLFRLCTDISKMTSLGLQAIAVLPQAYHSHVFLHWMKAAATRKAPAAAAQILDVMMSRGSQPETAHFNLLLKALFRTDTDPYILQAENIAWRMIEEARKSPPERLPRMAASEFISRRWMSKKDAVPDNEPLKDIAKANATTFAMLMWHHGRRLQWEHFDYLARRFKDSGMQPNAEFLNVLMDNQCRQGKYNQVWKTYKSLTDVPEGAPGVFPDGSSIRCLWKTLRLALGDQATRDDPDLPRPRELLAETVQWWTLCRRRHDAEQYRIGLATADHGALSCLMMHCFSYTVDLAGSLVGLHILRKKFGIFPSDKAAAVLQKQAAWVDMRRQAENVRSHYYHSGVYKKNIEKLGQVYYILMERRFERMGITKNDYAKLDEEKVGDIGLNLLSEFIRVVLKRSHSPEVVEAMITEAKKEAGVPDMETGDLDAFGVA